MAELWGRPVCDVYTVYMESLMKLSNIKSTTNTGETKQYKVYHKVFVQAYFPDIINKVIVFKHIQRE